MSETELARRFIASQASIRGEDLSKGRVPEATWPKIIAASKKLAAAPLWIDDSGDIGMLEIRAKARRLYSQNPDGLGLVIVDYLQLLRTESRSENRAEVIGQMSRGLKMLARELDVPVIALSQLNRSVESRNPKIPLLSDLRESGAVEQDADVVVFIYRDDYYNPSDSATPSERPGEADLLIAKNRNGPVGKVTLTFRPEYPRFMSYTQEERFA
jgi:replicative DNA helicase